MDRRNSIFAPSRGTSRIKLFNSPSPVLRRNSCYLPKERPLQGLKATKIRPHLKTRGDQGKEWRDTVVAGARASIAG